MFYSHPFREAQPPGKYAAWAFADQAGVDFRFGVPIVDADRAAVDWWAVITTGAGEVETLAGVSLLRFDGEGRVAEQHDVWASVQSRADVSQWAR